VFKYKKKYFITALILLQFTLPTILPAMNQKAQEAFDEALKESKAGNWRSAAKEYKAAVLYADNHVVKSNALKSEANAYKNAELYYKEYKCLKTLIENAPEQINFKETIEREYEIANLFFNGYRETPYPWIMPWIKDDNHAIEIYETVQKQSPYAKYIPSLQIRLASLYLEKGKNEKAEKTYKKIITNHIDTKVTKTAYLDLANLYLQLGKRGDGDGYNTSAAKNLLQKFIKKYPNAPEIPWAKNSLKKTYEIGAAKLLKLAEYYNDKDNTKVAKRYIRDILVNYPETKIVIKAEKLLNSIDMPLNPQPIPPIKKEKSKYSTKNLAKIAKEVLVIPANSEDKWLRPVDEEPLLLDKTTKTEYENKI
jgi:tetratricopeptide (TPR) repeat protein